MTARSPAKKRARTKRKTPAKKRGPPFRIPWEEARMLYTTSLRMTYDQLADRLINPETGKRPDPSTLRKRGAEERWTALREQNRAQIIQETLRRGIEDVVGAGAALNELTYSEAIQGLTMLQHCRRQAIREETTPDGGVRSVVDWSPKTFLDWSRAMRELTTTARLACGLPTSIEGRLAEPADVDLTLLSDSDLDAYHALKLKAMGISRDDDAEG